MKTIPRNEISSELLQDMMKTEAHHEHEIVEVNGVLRWKADPFIAQLTVDCDLNYICIGFYENGNNKNTESYRELYRKMGFSLFGYWEVFYWEMNNEIAEEYNPPVKE